MGTTTVQKTGKLHVERDQVGHRGGLKRAEEVFLFWHTVHIHVYIYNIPVFEQGVVAPCFKRGGGLDCVQVCLIADRYLVSELGSLVHVDGRVLGFSCCCWLGMSPTITFFGPFIHRILPVTVRLHVLYFNCK
jgi:hypothetical protein